MGNGNGIAVANNSPIFCDNGWPHSCADQQLHCQLHWQRPLMLMMRRYCLQKLMHQSLQHCSAEAATGWPAQPSSS
eukprot:6175871-Pleurochrysis_carterae.AAC.2